MGNQENMDVRGFNLSGGMTAAAEGSFELATKLREYAKGISFHFKFCTASFKDAGQLRARGAVSVNGSAHVAQGLQVGGTASINALRVAGATCAQGQAFVNGSLRVTENLILDKQQLLKELDSTESPEPIMEEIKELIKVRNIFADELGIIVTQ